MVRSHARLAAAQNTANDAAKDFPNRSIKIVVPFPAGGPSDVLARLIGQKMTEDWGQPVVIENRARRQHGDRRAGRQAGAAPTATRC